MNEWINLIDERIGRATRTLPFMKSESCVVTKIDSSDKNRVTVQVLSNKAFYTVPNYSGSDVSVGEFVQLFYKGNVSLEATGYIGASLNKNSDTPQPPVPEPQAVIIIGSSNAGEITGGEKIISEIGFSCEDEVNGIIYVNFNILGISKTDIQVTVIIDDVPIQYSPLETMDLDLNKNVAFTYPFSVEEGNHVMKIVVIGEGTILDVGSFIGAQNIMIYTPPPVDYNTPINMSVTLNLSGEPLLLNMTREE